MKQKYEFGTKVDLGGLIKPAEAAEYAFAVIPQDAAVRVQRLGRGAGDYEVEADLLAYARATSARILFGVMDGVVFEVRHDLTAIHGGAVPARAGATVTAPDFGEPEGAG